MKNYRSNASECFYTRAELHGVELWGTGTGIDDRTVPRGLYCYDLYRNGEQSDDRTIFISKEQREGETEGAVLCAEPLHFDEHDFISLQGITMFEDESMWKLEEIKNPALRQEEQEGDIGFQMQTM